MDRMKKMDVTMWSEMVNCYVSGSLLATEQTRRQLLTTKFEISLIEPVGDVTVAVST